MTGPALQLESVSLSYGGRTILSSIDCIVAHGRWIAVVGPNASGKSTLLRAIAGRHVPSKGVIRVEGTTGFAHPPEQLPEFLTIRQCLEIQASALGLPGVPHESDALATRLDLKRHADTPLRAASLGTRQKLAVVLAMLGSPPLLLLDEVFNGLDLLSAQRLRFYLREWVDRGSTLLLATHSLDVVVRCCDEVLLLDAGSLAGRWSVADFRGERALEDLENVLTAASAFRN